ncbi:hypothetical protein ERJ75_001140700 [Trypanosoma vivax]|nr:hypothetical protein ERJ75_001140700 [Trypanosoma vivax]
MLGAAFSAGASDMSAHRPPFFSRAAADRRKRLAPVATSHAPSPTGRVHAATCSTRATGDAKKTNNVAVPDKVSHAAWPTDTGRTSASACVPRAHANGRSRVAGEAHARRTSSDATAPTGETKGSASTQQQGVERSGEEQAGTRETKDGTQRPSDARRQRGCAWHNGEQYAKIDARAHSLGTG